MKRLTIFLIGGLFVICSAWLIYDGARSARESADPPATVAPAVDPKNQGEAIPAQEVRLSPLIERQRQNASPTPENTPLPEPEPISSPRVDARRPEIVQKRPITVSGYSEVSNHGSLNQHLSREALFESLKTTEPEPGESIRAMRNRKHRLMSAMHPQPNPGFVMTLAEIVHQTDQDTVIRDYAIQHLGLAYSTLTAAERAVAADVIRQAWGEVDSSLAGTALLAGMRLSRNHPDFDEDEVARHALNVLQNDQAATVSLITALQVAAELKPNDVLPYAERLAAESANTMVRRSARSAIRSVSNDSTQLAARSRDEFAQEDCHDCP